VDERAHHRRCAASPREMERRAQDMDDVLYEGRRHTGDGRDGRTMSTGRSGVVLSTDTLLPPSPHVNVLSPSGRDKTSPAPATPSPELPQRGAIRCASQHSATESPASASPMSTGTRRYFRGLAGGGGSETPSPGVAVGVLSRFAGAGAASEFLCEDDEDIAGGDEDEEGDDDDDTRAPGVSREGEGGMAREAGAYTRSR